jgi:hypothetical protein
MSATLPAASHMHTPPQGPRFDGAAAHAFLTALGADPARVHYRGIHWDKNHQPKHDRAVHLAPAFQPRSPRLEELQQQGFRLYWLPNGGPHDADVTACTYLFVEWDDQPLEWQLSAWQELGLPEPTALLNTGGKSIHAYWRLSDPIPPDRWRALTARLISYCKSDPTCKNPSRLMRLAGSSYIHKTDDRGPNGEPLGGTLGRHRARMIRDNPQAVYTAEQFEQCLPPLPAPEPPPQPALPPPPVPLQQTSGTDAPPRSYEEMERLVAAYPMIMADNGQREEALRLVCGLARCMELIGRGKADAIALASRYHPQAADTFEGIDRWRFDQFDAGSFIKQCKAAGVDVRRRDLPKPPPPTPPLDGAPFIPPDDRPDVLEQLDDEDRAELLAEIKAFRERLEVGITLEQLFPPGVAFSVINYARQQGLDPLGFVLPILTTASSVMGNRVRVSPEPDSDWSEPSILWGMNIAPAGGGKSPISSASIEKPLLPWQIREREKHSAALARWKHDRAEAEKASKAAASEVGGDGSDPLEEFLASNPQPAKRHLLIVDATFEKLEMILAAGATPGLLAYHDEMGRWFSQLCRNPQQSDRTKWLSLYPGSPILTDRVGRDDVLVPHPAVSLMGSIQPARLEGLWGADARANEGQADGDGLWSRFLVQLLPDWDFTYGAQPARLAPTLASLYEQVDAATPDPLDPDAAPHQVISLAPDALPLFATWVNDLRDERRRRCTDEDKQYIAKLRGATLRLALALHGIQQASCGLPLLAPISLDTTRAAILLTAHFLTQRDQMVAGLIPDAAGSDVKRLLARGSEWRKAHGDAPVPMKQIRDWSLPRRSISSRERRQWLEQVVAGTPGLGELRTTSRSVEWLPPEG